MNDDMKELQKSAEKKGYEVTRYEEFDHKSNQKIKKRYMFIFEKGLE